LYVNGYLPVKWGMLGRELREGIYPVDYISRRDNKPVGVLHKALAILPEGGSRRKI
jgi:hypothetical protein